MDAIMSGTTNGGNGNGNNGNAVSNSVICGATDANGRYNFALVPTSIEGTFGSGASAMVISVALTIGALLAILM